MQHIVMNFGEKCGILKGGHSSLICIHTACPSSVSLEISADGTTPVPICPPLPTSGLTYVKFQLPRPEITTSVCLRLHRPRDSNTIGLSQIMLLGVTAFGSIGNGSSQSGLLLSSDDGAAKSRYELFMESRPNDNF